MKAKGQELNADDFGSKKNTKSVSNKEPFHSTMNQETKLVKIKTATKHEDDSCRQQADSNSLLQKTQKNSKTSNFLRLFSAFGR